MVQVCCGSSIMIVIHFLSSHVPVDGSLSTCCGNENLDRSFRCWLLVSLRRVLANHITHGCIGKVRLHGQRRWRRHADVTLGDWRVVVGHGQGHGNGLAQPSEVRAGRRHRCGRHMLCGEMVVVSGVLSVILMCMKSWAEAERVVLGR